MASNFFLSLPRPVKQGLMILCDAIIGIIVTWLSFELRIDNWSFFHGNQWLTLIAFYVFSFPVFVSCGLYRAIFRYIGWNAFFSIARAFGIYGIIFFCTFTLIGFDGVPRSIGVIQPLLLLVGIASSRFFVRHWLGGLYEIKHPSNQVTSNVLIYGVNPLGRQLLSSLSKNKQVLVSGFIDEDKSLKNRTVDEIIVYAAVDIQSVIKRLNITDIFLAIPASKSIQRREIISSLSGYGVRVRTLPGIIEFVENKSQLLDPQDLDMNDLLGRPVVPPDPELLRKNIENKVVLVTGAGGSIGSELCRQIILFSPASLILLDNSEYSLYSIYEELKKVQDRVAIENDAEFSKLQVACSSDANGPLKLVPYLASVQDKSRLMSIFQAHKPVTVFHAAAYKHVTLVEQNPTEGISNNVFGTLICAEVSMECGVTNFTLVSTDKAVRPTSVMGASKRVAELVLQGLANEAAKSNQNIIFSMVRFGNVLGSSGSVTPLFSRQIASGGPITLTHPEVTRYFMTIPEAAQLVIQASAMASGGEVFVLDMGSPVRIYDLAIKMVYLSGLLIKDEKHPHGNIEIKVTGLRSGEKLYEELLIGESPKLTAHPKIMKANEDFFSFDVLKQDLEDLNRALKVSDINLIFTIVKKLVPGYQSHDKAVTAK